MENQQGYPEKTYGEKTSFDQFLDGEELPSSEISSSAILGRLR